ncbi:hypothetical protein ACS0TY_035855 [Phlomoides rotata]
MIKVEDLVNVNIWFDSIKQWSEDVIDNNRIIWTNWFGVPMHAWNPNFFNLVSCQFGKLIRIDEDTLQRRRLQMARILIRTPYHELPRTLIAVAIDGKIFHLRVREEAEDLEEDREDDLSRDTAVSDGNPAGGVNEKSEIDPDDNSINVTPLLLEHDPASLSAPNTIMQSPTPKVDINYAQVSSNADVLVDPVATHLIEVDSVDPTGPVGPLLPNKFHRKSKKVSWADQPFSAQEGINLVVDLNNPELINGLNNVAPLEVTEPSDPQFDCTHEVCDSNVNAHEQRHFLPDSGNFQRESHSNYEDSHASPDVRRRPNSSKNYVSQTEDHGKEIDFINLGISE